MMLRERGLVLQRETTEENETTRGEERRERGSGMSEWSNDGP